MKKILGIVSAVVISALVFAGCRFEPQYRVELEKQTVTDGIFPQVIERTVTYVQKTRDGDWEEDKNVLSTWELSVDDIPDSVCIINSDDAQALYPALGNSFKGRKATLYFHFDAEPGDIQTTVTDADEGSSKLDITMNWNADVCFKCAGMTANLSGIKVLGGTINPDGSTDLKVDIGEGEGVLKVPAKVTRAEIKDFMTAQSDSYIPSVSFEDLPVIGVTSSDVKSGVWDTRIANAGGGQNISPDLKWDAVEGATRYVVVMIDGSWLHMDVFTTETSLAEGAYDKGSKGEQYVGPYPPKGSTHTYSVFVFALKDEPGKTPFVFDHGGNNINDIFDGLNTDSSGNTGNVLAYGRLDGNFTNNG